MALQATPTFTGYTPNDQGPGYYFQRSDGSNFLGYGPEADRLASTLDQTQSPDMRTASIDPTVAYDPAAPFGSAASVPTAAPPAPVTRAGPMPNQGPVLSPAALGAQITQAGRSADVLQNMIVPKPSIMPAAPAAPGAPAMFNASAYPTAPPANQLPLARMPTAGIAAEQPMTQPQPFAQLPAMGKPGLRLASTKVETEGGMPPESAALLQRAYGNEAKAVNDETNLETAQLTQQATALDKKNALDAVQIENLKDTKTKIEAQRAQDAKDVLKVYDAGQKALQDANSRKIDDFRAFRGKPGATIGAALAIILGGIGGGMQTAAGHPTGNAGLQAVNKILDDDVQNQRDEITRGVDTAKNNIAGIRDKYGLTLDQATHAYNVAVTEQTAAKADQMAAASGSATAKANLTGMQVWKTSRLADITKAALADTVGKRKTEEDYRANYGNADPLALLKRQNAYDDEQAIYRAMRDPRNAGLTSEQIKYKIDQQNRARAGGTASTRIAVPLSEVSGYAAQFDTAAKSLGYANDAKGLPVPGAAGQAHMGTGLLSRAMNAEASVFAPKSLDMQRQNFHIIAGIAARNGQGNGDTIQDRTEDIYQQLVNPRNPEIRDNIIRTTGQYLKTRMKTLQDTENASAGQGSLLGNSDNDGTLDTDTQ